MKRTCLVLQLLLVGCASRPVESPAGHIILAAEHSPGTRVPVEADVARFESELASLFAKPDERFEQKSKARLSEYLIRYYGTIRGGREVIIGEGTHVSQMNITTFQQVNSRQDTVLLSPWGGGNLYFSAVYDPTAKKVSSVRFNAPL